MPEFTSEQVHAYAAYGLASALRDSLFAAYNAALQNAASNGQEELLIPLLWACNEAEGAVARLRETVKRLEHEITTEAWVGILDDAQVAQPRQASSPLDSGEQILTIDHRQEIAGRIVAAVQAVNNIPRVVNAE
jgi:hypothetical protein